MDIDRREFIQQSSFAAGGLLIAPTNSFIKPSRTENLLVYPPWT